MNKDTGNNSKEVVYVDVDDEITSIIDKVRGAHQRIVALVLPKRAGVLQSVVNMKLLKRASDEAKKHIVLITAEAGLMPLAATVGMYVARSLQSKPEIPDGAINVRGHSHEPETAELDDEDDAYDPRADRKRPVGELASRKGAGIADLSPEEEAIELDDDPSEEAGGRITGKQKKGKGDKKLSIPNFNKFRTWLILGGVGLVGLIVVWYFAFSVMPKATITVATDSSAIEAKADFTLKTDTNTLDLKQSILPAQSQQTQKTTSQQVDSTGQVDKGSKATGTIRFYNCSTGDTLLGAVRTIPAGTGVSAGGLTFITNTSVNVQPSHFKADGSCQRDIPSDSVGVTAQAGGEKYNVASTTYSVAGYPSVSGTGSEMAGGTSNIVKVIAQADIENAKQRLAGADTTGIKQELQQGLRAKNVVPIVATFKSNAPEYTVSGNVGDEAANVTVTQKATYSMLGATQSDLQKLVAESISDKFDPQKQKILSYGLDQATYSAQNVQDPNAPISLEATAVVGSDLNVDSLKKQVAGKKSNQAKEIIGANPGVTRVDVKYSPFWVSSIPKKTSKITLTIEKPSAKTNGSKR